MPEPTPEQRAESLDRRDEFWRLIIAWEHVELGQNRTAEASLIDDEIAALIADLAARLYLTAKGILEDLPAPHRRRMPVTRKIAALEAAVEDCPLAPLPEDKP